MTARLRWTLNLVVLCALTLAACTIDGGALDTNASAPLAGQDAGDIVDPEPQPTAEPATSEPPTPAEPTTSTEGAEPDENAEPSGDPAPTARPEPAEAPDDTASADDTAQPIEIGPETIGGPGLGDEYYPDYGNGGYDVAHYDLDFVWDDEARTVDAVANIELTPTQNLSQFNFDLTALDVTEISVDDVAATFERDGRELIITPAEPLPEDEPVTVRVAYEGTPRLVDSATGVFSGGWRDNGDTIIVIGEPEGAAGFYPVNEHPADKATYTITITADDDLAVAANGVETGRVESDGTITWTYESTDPQASYLTTIGIGDFVFHQGDPSESGVEVRHWFQPEVFDDSVATMARTGQMIDVFEDMFGVYPFDIYGSIVVEEELGFALETQTLSVFGGDLVDRFGTFEDIVAHELAHQWFGNHVALTQWFDIWLNEGFASYAEYLWFEAIDENYDIDAAMRAEYDDFGVLLNVPPGRPSPNALFHPSVYIRGALTLHALRVEVGDDSFFAILRTWADEFGGANATTSDFIRMSEDISGLDLGELFEAWLYEEQIPPFPRT